MSIGIGTGEVEETEDGGRKEERATIIHCPFDGDIEKNPCPLEIRGSMEGRRQVGSSLHVATEWRQGHY